MKPSCRSFMYEFFTVYVDGFYNTQVENQDRYE